MRLPTPRRITLLCLGLLWAHSATVASAESTVARIDPRLYLEHVKYLASEELKGRGTGTPELDKAAAYIAKHFREMGLQPVNGRSSYQEFQVTTNAKLGSGNLLEYEHDGLTRALKFREEFIPFNFSARGKCSAPVVFAGYGITAGEYGYDDYAGVDVKGKLVLVLRHEPQEFDEDSVFAGRIFTEHSQLFSKAMNARTHGARGVIFVNDIGNHGRRQGKLQEFNGSVGPADAGIPFVHVNADIAEEWLALAGENLADIQEAIDDHPRPRSFALPASLSVKVRVDISRNLKTVRNVAGYLPGEESEYVILGAHYDHLGLGEQFSMAPASAGTPHPGADDNASGTAGVLELARWFSARPRLKRGILFLAFAGEELGLLGSSHYVNHPELPLERAVAMINLDMIGRVRDGKVYLGGVGTGSTFRNMLETIVAQSPLNVDFSDTTGYGSSDHTSFTTRRIPVLFFFSGLHSDYHRPSDTWDKIDAPQTAMLLDLVAAVTARLAGQQGRPRFVTGTESSRDAGN